MFLLLTVAVIVRIWCFFCFYIIKLKSKLNIALWVGQNKQHVDGTLGYEIFTFSRLNVKSMKTNIHRWQLIMKIIVSCYCGI